MIEQLRGTINGQELSQEDVRRMEREKARKEEQISKHVSVLEGQVAALKEAKDKWCLIYKLLERKVDEYNARARQLELIPETAKHARGKRFEVKLDGDKAAEGVVSMMGGVDIVGAVEPHVTKLIKHYESDTANKKRRMSVVKDLIKALEISKEKLVKDIEVSLTRISCRFRSQCPHVWSFIFCHSLLSHHSSQAIKYQVTSCEEECASTKERLEADIQDKRNQLQLLNNKILSLNDRIDHQESTIKKHDAEYMQLCRQVKENMAKIKAVTDDIEKKMKDFRTGFDDECDRMREEIMSSNKEVNW
jgi:SMC interacting uncharacterized protein involved in chromosome segregation